MRIAFVIGSLTGGGAERVVAMLANEFVNRGYEVGIISIASSEKSYSISEQVKLLYCLNSYKIPGISFIRRVGDLRSTLKDFEPEVCISFTVAVNIYSLLASIGQKWRLIICERNDPKFDPQSRFLRLLRKMTYNLADGYVFQTTGERDYFPEKIRNRSSVIANPINSSIPRPFEGVRDKRFVTAVRLEPQKNLKLAIDAFYDFCFNHEDFTFDIYGEGAQKEYLQQYINERGLADKVHLLGRSDKLYEDMKNAFAFILSSDYEGMSNSMLEAMALGLPVISTDYPSGGARMVIDDHNNGILVPVGNKGKMCECMTELVECPDLATRLSDNACKIKDVLSVTNILDMWEESIKTWGHKSGK